jgi:hypothetical protein
MASQTHFFSRSVVAVAFAVLASLGNGSDARADDSGSVSGKVVARQSGFPVEGATVNILAYGGSAQVRLTTDSAGWFNAIGLTPGQYVAYVAKGGMEDASSAFEVCPGAQTTLNVLMIKTVVVCSATCGRIPTQPKPTLFSPSSTTVVFNKWTGTPSMHCL